MTDTDLDWVPLSQRVGKRPSRHALIEGVPEWLHQHLTGWMYRTLQQTSGPPVIQRGSHGLTVESRQVMVRLRTSHQPWGMARDDSQFLDALDATLFCALWVEGMSDDPAIELEQLLVAAGSAWRVSERFRGLERRVDSTVTRAVGATTTVPTAGDHLAAAWAAAYGRDPDADKAYDESVLAVEALACPLVCPKNTRRSLGTVVKDLRNQAGQWELTIGDTTTGNPMVVEPMLAMLELLWRGQSRHAGSANSRRQTQVEGESAVHLAATLVQLLGSGVLRRR